MPSRAEIAWTPTHVEATRRLAGVDIAVTASHTNISDAECVVGGFDTNNPAYIYIGGPCSGLTAGTGTGSSSYKVGSNFRWVEMVTFHAELNDDKMSSPANLLPKMDGDGKEMLFQYAKETPNSHAEVGVGGVFKFDAAEVSNAGFFMSTTSYLAQANFEFADNYFVTGKTGDKVDRLGPVCTELCSGKCNDKCPATKTKVTAGDYKYSLFAAAFDFMKNDATKGWTGATAKFGKGDPKVLTGFLNVYQGVDFTNMQADELTITKPDGTTVKYADMKACSETACGLANVVEVKSLSLKAKGWEGMSYSFPGSYNVGAWSKSGETFTFTPKETKTVKIQAVRPSAGMLKNAPGNMKRSTKVLALMYSFDITGVTAKYTDNEQSGMYMVYDPTVQNSAKAAKSGTGADKAADSNQNGVSAAAPHGLFFVKLLASFVGVCFFVQS